MANEIVNWQERLANSARDIASRERPSVSQIGLRSGVMMYQGQQIPGNKLQCIIIASATENRYDTKPFDPNNIQPPDCFGLSISGEDMVPSDKAVAIQAERCDLCAHHHWAPNPKKAGKNHKACKERRRLALLPADVLTKGNFKTAELAVLTIPVTSVKYWGTWTNAISAEFGRPPWAMLVDVSARPHPVNQFEVNFTTVGPIEEQYLSELEARIQAAEDQLLTPFDSSGMTVPGSDPMKPAKERKF